MSGTRWVEEGVREYTCELRIEFLPGTDPVTLEVAVTGDGIASDGYADICSRMQSMAQTAVVEGLKDIQDLLDQLVGVGHYSTGGISQEDWRTLSETVANESLDHLHRFLSLKVEGAIAEAMSWAVLKYDLTPVHADVVGSWIRDTTGLEQLRRTRTARRKQKIKQAREWIPALTRMVLEAVDRLP